MLDESQAVVIVSAARTPVAKHRHGSISSPSHPAEVSLCNTVSDFNSAKVKVNWKEGPDLVVSGFIPPILKSEPGKTFVITESTENRGKIAASPMVTRYYLSLTQPINPATDRVIGQRNIPMLAPGADSSVDEVPFTVPLDLAAGLYYLTACADADQQVIETNEVNNCAQDLLENRKIVMVETGNHPPIANDQSLRMNWNASLAITLTASDEDHDPLIYAILAPPAHGTLSGVAPNVSYTPAAGYHGPDSFTFKANDAKADSNVATVSIRVNAVPVANDQFVLDQKGIAKAITLTATDADNDALTYAVVTPPAHGALSGAAPNLTYTPAGGYFGLDHFTFKANDGFADSNVATVSIRVNAPPDCAKGSPSPPYLSWPPNHKFRPGAIAGVSDPDGDPVSLVVTSIRQDEPVKSPGTGNFSPDATISPLQLRAEREGPPGDGRVYHVNFTASDNQGGVCTGSVTVCVPHDQSQPVGCGDGGPLYDSTLP